MLDLEDAVAENQKDAARYSLYHALQEIDYHGVERVVRINGLDTPSLEGGYPGLRGRRGLIPSGSQRPETAQDVRTVEEHVLAAEREFGRPEGSTLLMAALESCKGRFKCPGGLPVLRAPDRNRPFRRRLHKRTFQTTITGTGVELMGPDSI